MLGLALPCLLDVRWRNPGRWPATERDYASNFESRLACYLPSELPNSDTLALLKARHYLGTRELDTPHSSLPIWSVNGMAGCGTRLRDWTGPDRTGLDWMGWDGMDSMSDLQSSLLLDPSSQTAPAACANAPEPRMIAKDPWVLMIVRHPLLYTVHRGVSTCTLTKGKKVS